MVQVCIMLGDSACNSFLLNESTSHFSHDVENYNGTVLGSNGPMPDAITKWGVVWIMCVKIRCYIGRFSKGSEGQNWIVVYYGFEWLIKVLLNEVGAIGHSQR